MRRTVPLLLATLMMTLLIAPASALPQGEHPGCRGIEQALGKASSKGRTALMQVADKFGCDDPIVEPVDLVPCPEGQLSIARWTYTGEQNGPLEHGYPTWIGEWTLTGGGGAGPVLNARPDGGGFYWEESVAGSVSSIVMASSTGEVVTIAEPGNPISQNHFVDRTGINLVNFCG